MGGLHHEIKDTGSEITWDFLPRLLSVEISTNDFFYANVSFLGLEVVEGSNIFKELAKVGFPKVSGVMIPGRKIVRVLEEGERMESKVGSVIG